MSRAAPDLEFALACAGVGHVRRGYETFVQALFERLRGLAPVVLYKGAGPETEDERPLACLRRTGVVGRALGLVLQQKKVNDLETWTFGVSLARALGRRPAAVVYTPELRTARALLARRGALPPGQRPALVFHNGAPYPARKLGPLDLVQQLTGPAYDEAVAAGLDRSRLVPLPIDTDRFRPGDQAAARAALGLPADRPVVLCAAAHEAFKRIDLLIDAVADLPGALLVVAGHPGPETEALRRRAAERLGERVDLRSVPPDRMPELHRAADVFALPSRKEGFGLVLTEAMATGVPVVTQDDDTRRWLVGDAGVLVACDAPGALRGALERLLGDPAERRRLGALGRERVEASFSWRALVPRYLELFEEARALAAAGVEVVG